jgi:hypothetical protein
MRRLLFTIPLLGALAGGLGAVEAKTRFWRRAGETEATCEDLYSTRVPFLRGISSMLEEEIINADNIALLGDSTSCHEFLEKALEDQCISDVAGDPFAEDSGVDRLCRFTEYSFSIIRPLTKILFIIPANLDTYDEKVGEEMQNTLIQTTLIITRHLLGFGRRMFSDYPTDEPEQRKLQSPYLVDIVRTLVTDIFTLAADEDFKSRVEEILGK